MAQTIKIKRSSTTAVPGGLGKGELAYSGDSDKLFIGAPSDSAVITIGGLLYTNMLDHIAGELTAESAILVDADSKIDKLLSGNIRINHVANQIDTSEGNLIINPFGNLVIKTGTVDLTTQATELKLLDNSATSLTISEGTDNYITLDTTNSLEKIKFGKQVEFSGEYTLPILDGDAKQALVTDGGGVVSFTTIPEALAVNSSDDNTTANVDLLADDLNFVGSEGLGVTVAKSGTDVTLTLTAEDSTASAKGVVIIDSGQGISVSYSSGTATISGVNSTSTTKGVASFDATDFTVSGGAVVLNPITLGTSTLNPGATTTSIAGLEELVVDKLTVDDQTISTSLSDHDIILSPHGEGTVKVPTGYKNRTGFYDANSLATKEYVDAVKQALIVKDSVRAATTVSISATYNNTAGTLTNSGSHTAFSIDGISLVAEDRVLIKDQTAGEENGIYEVTTVGDASTAWVLTRAIDANIGTELVGGTFTFVTEGSIQQDKGFIFTHDSVPTLGTTDITITQFSSAGIIIAGDGLGKTGNDLFLNDDNITLEISSDNVRIKGISSTAAGDLLIGAASDGGYTRLVKPSVTNTTAGAFVVGEIYTITATNSTNFTLIGAADSSIGTVFTATGVGAGSGTASSSNPILSIDAVGTASWSTTLDGGTF
jgi:hypothetical protein